MSDVSLGNLSALPRPLKDNQRAYNSFGPTQQEAQVDIQGFCCLDFNQPGPAGRQALVVVGKGGSA